MDAYGLEGAGCRVRLLAGAKAGRSPDDRGELGGPFYGTCGNDGASDRPGARLLPVVAQNPGDLGLPGRIQKFGGSQTRAAHPHVERPVGLERKAALGAVELHRAHPDIQGDSVDESDAALRKDAVHLAEILLDEFETRVRDERSSRFNRVRIAIESYHSSRPRREDGARVAARSKCAVDHRLASAQSERRDDFADQ